MRAAPSNPGTKILSNLSSIVHVLVTMVIGYLISLRPTLSLELAQVAAFAVTSKLFSMAFAEDSKASRKTRIYSTIVLASSILLLTGLSSFEIILGILILGLYVVYPFCKERAPFDVVHHGLRYVFLFILGLGSQAFWNGTTFMAISAILLFSFAGELLAALRWGSDLRESTTSILGIKRSLVAIILLVFAASLVASFVMNNMFEFPMPFNGTLVPFYLIPALALDLYLTVPLMKKLNAEQVEAFHLVRKKEVIGLIVALLLIIVVFQTGRLSTTATADSTDYSFTVNIRTFIAGPHSWDVPWIIFNYVNQDNYYYVVLHKDGTLELSEKLDGQSRFCLSWCATRLSPFEWHKFQIVLNQTTVNVNLDGKYQLTAPRELAAQNSRIIISPSPPIQDPPIWIACSCSITVNQ